MYKSQGQELSLFLYNNEYKINVFPFWANYRRDFLEKYEWKTDVLTSYDGTEQRASIRSMPRKTVEFEVFTRSEDRAALENFLWQGAGTLYAVPWWNRGIKLTSSASSTKVHLDPTYLKGSDYVIAYISPYKYELRQIVLRDADSITLDSAVSWSNLYTIYPALLGVMKPSSAVTRVTGDFTVSVISFDIPMSETYVADSLFGVHSDNIHGWYPVMHWILDWNGGVQGSLDYKVTVIDNTLSLPFVEVESETPISVRSVKWFLNGQDKIQDFIDFMFYCKGRAYPFWLPTGTADFIPVSKSDNNLTVKNVGYSHYISNRSGRNNIAIVSRYGAKEYCTITGAIETGDTEVLTLAASVTTPIEDIQYICFLDLVRLNADRVEIAYKHSHFATAACSVKVLKT